MSQSLNQPGAMILVLPISQGKLSYASSDKRDENVVVVRGNRCSRKTGRGRRSESSHRQTAFQATTQKSPAASLILQDFRQSH